MPNKSDVLGMKLDEGLNKLARNGFQERNILLTMAPGIPDNGVHRIIKQNIGADKNIDLVITCDLSLNRI